MAFVTGAGPSSLFPLLLPPPKPPPLSVSPALRSKKLYLRPRLRLSHAVSLRVFCSLTVAAKTSHLRTVKSLFVISGVDTRLVTVVASSWLCSVSMASPSSFLPPSSGFPELAATVSSLDRPEPPEPPDPPDPYFSVYSSPALLAWKSSSKPELQRSPALCRSGLCFDSFTFTALVRLITALVRLLTALVRLITALVRLITALCRQLPKFYFRFLSGYCYGYQLLLWCFELLLASSLVFRIVRRLQRNSKSIVGIFASPLAMLSTKDSIFCRPWLSLGTLCHYYSLVEMFDPSYPPFGWNVCVAGTQVFFRVTMLAYLSLNDMVCWLRNALEVSLLYGSHRHQRVTLAWLVEDNVQKCLWESLPSFELYGFEAGVRRFSALVSVFVLSNFSFVWGSVASTREAVFQLTISSSLGASSQISDSPNLPALSYSTSSLYNNFSIETRGHLYAFNCESAMFASIYQSFVSRFACVAVVSLAGLALLSTFVNICSIFGG